MRPDNAERLLHPSEPAVPSFDPIDDDSNAEMAMEEALFIEE
jgi:hypothetical protein